MMLSRSTFKDDLIAYRASMKPPQKPGDPGPLGRGNLSSADLTLINRWIKDGRGEDIWRKLKCPNISAAEFIKTVLLARRSAQGTVNRTYGTARPRGRGRTRGWADELTDLKEQVLRALSASPAAIDPADLVKLFENCAQRVRYYDTLFSLTEHGGIPGRATFRLSRKDQGGTRVRTLFMQIVGDYFFSTIGAWMDAEVAALTEIAFPGREVDRDDVIAARKPSTKSTRRPAPN